MKSQHPLVTALKILHDDQVSEITNRSSSMAQVDHQSTGEKTGRRKSGRNLRPSIQSE